MTRAERTGVDLPRAKAMAKEITDVIVGGTPPEFQYALTLATAFYFRANFPHELEECLRLHAENLRAILEELDKQDVLDLSAFDVKDLLG